MIASPRIIVVYEDSLVPGTPASEYGPHKLLKSCLRDAGHSTFESKLDARPLRGANKVLDKVLPE